MLAEKDQTIDEAVGQVYKITRDEMLRQRMEAREEYYWIERTNQVIMEKLKTKMFDLKTENTDLKTEVDELKAELARYKVENRDNKLDEG